MKILIANDGSDFGTAAVTFAADFLRFSVDSNIKIITVIEPAASIEVEALIDSVEELTDPSNPAFQQATRIGEDSIKILRESGVDMKNDVSFEVLAGPAARTIVEKAEAWKADLIVVGSHGRRFWKRAWLGSVSDRVSHHAACSVLIVRPRE